MIAGILRCSAVLNRGHAPTDMLSTALLDDLPVARFHLVRRNRSMFHLNGFDIDQTGCVRATELVQTFMLDWLTAHFAAPEVIKIEVDKAEVAVLARRSRVLELATKIPCEVATRSSIVARDALNRRGYPLYGCDGPSAERVPVIDAPPTTLAVRKLRSASRRAARGPTLDTMRKETK